MIGKSKSLGLRSTGAVLAVVLFSFSVIAAADFNLSKGLNTDQRYLYTSLYTRHFDPEPEHVNDQKMLGFEIDTDTEWLWGFAMFDNSFGQDSQYLYLGQKWRAFDSDHWYYKVTGGLLHGYREPYEDKIPLNDLGIAPAIIPGLGYRSKSFFAEYAQLGLSAGLITVGIKF